MAIGVGVGAGLVGLGLATRAAWQEFSQATKVAAQTNAVIKSTGGLANVTAKHVDSLASAILRKSGIDDEAIKTGENMLLTFRNVRNEVGAGNDIFDQATRAAVDMDVAMTHGNSSAESLAKSNLRLGKALNDPLKGMTALGRVGVQFTEGQKKQIKAMVESGDVMGAQKVILKELNAEFGGSAEALGKTLPGQINILKESFRNFAASLLTKAIPALTDFFGFLTKLKDAGSIKVAVDMVIAKGEDIRDSLQRQLNRVDWGAAGRQIGQALSAGIVFTDDAVVRLLALLNAHAQDFANLGAVLALRMVSTLLNPSFWIAHWQITAGIALAVFGGSILKGLKALAPLAARLFARSFLAGPILRIGDALLFQFLRLPVAVQQIARAVGAFLYRDIASAIGKLRGAFGRIPGWIKAAFTVGAIVSFIGAVQTLIGYIQTLLGLIAKIHLPQGGGGVSSKTTGSRGYTAKALGGRITGGIPGRDSVASMLMPDEVVYNPRYPAAGLAALAEEGIGPWQGMAAGGRPRKFHGGKHKGGRRQSERQAEKRERAKTQPPRDLELAISRARNRHDNVALLAALKRKESWLIRHISLTKSIDNKIALTDELTSVQDEIASLEAGEGAPDNSADLQAQLDQANARLGFANKSAALANAFVGTGVFAGGESPGGGHTFVFPSLIPDAEMVRRATGHIVGGLGDQGYRPATQQHLGV